MRDDDQMTGINPDKSETDKEKKKITSYSHHMKQNDNKDDRLSMFVDDISI